MSGQDKKLKKDIPLNERAITIMMLNFTIKNKAKNPSISGSTIKLNDGSYVKEMKIKDGTSFSELFVFSKDNIGAFKDLRRIIVENKYAKSIICTVDMVHDETNTYRACNVHVNQDGIDIYPIEAELTKGACAGYVSFNSIERMENTDYEPIDPLKLSVIKYLDSKEMLEEWEAAKTRGIIGDELNLGRQQTDSGHFGRSL